MFKGSFGLLRWIINSDRSYQFSVSTVDSRSWARVLETYYFVNNRVQQYFIQLSYYYVLMIVYIVI